MEATLTGEVESEVALVFDLNSVDMLPAASFRLDTRERLGGGVGVLRHGREGAEWRNGTRVSDDSFTAKVVSREKGGGP
jgi:hypothetical protein